MSPIAFPSVVYALALVLVLPGKAAWSPCKSEHAVDDATCLLQAKQPVVTKNVAFDSVVEDFEGLGLHAWSGMDLPRPVGAAAGQLSLLSTATTRWHAKRHESSARAGSHFRILGHYNTGTHLLRELLLKNFDPSVDVPDADFAGVLNGCKFWKHSSLAVLQKKSPKTLEGCGTNLIGLAMVRNPLSWLRSFHHVAFDLYKCNKGEDWLTRPCAYPPSVPGLLGNTRYPNVETIWTNWTQDYDSLAQYGFKKSLVIRYEDLVMNTSGVLAQIAALANTKIKPSVLEQVEKGMNPLAEHKTDAHTFAVEKITKRSYLSEYTPDELQQVCSRIDRATMRLHGYSDCDDLSL